MQSGFTFENSSQLDLPRFWAMLIGGMLFMLCGAFAISLTAGLVFNDTKLAFVFYPVGLALCGLAVTLVHGSPIPAVALWRIYIVATGATIAGLPIGLIVHSVRSPQEDQTWLGFFDLSAWPVVATCLLLGGFLIAVGRVAGRRSRGGL